jgi:hypothetical protein
MKKLKDLMKRLESEDRWAGLPPPPTQMEELTTRLESGQYELLIEKNTSWSVKCRAESCLLVDHPPDRNNSNRGPYRLDLQNKNPTTWSHISDTCTSLALNPSASTSKITLSCPRGKCLLLGRMACKALALNFPERFTRPSMTGMRQSRTRPVV